MKKNLLISLTSLFFYAQICAQTITPALHSEQCPFQGLTFTVTVPGVANNSCSVIGQAISLPTGSSGLNYTTIAGVFFNQSLPNFDPSTGLTTLTFTGRFADNNTPQNFQVIVKDNTQTVIGTYNFTYTEIASFYPTISGLAITPNLSSITATRCQVGSFNITFPNLKYSNTGPLPAVSDGTVTEYQYVIPTGWSMVNNAGATVVSTGAPILGTNSTTITSDLTHGDASSIQITPINTCAGGLVNGPTASIPISRPEPPLTITASTSPNSLCSGSKTFTLTGAPAGSTIAWSVDNTAVATIPTNSTGSSVTATYVSGGTFNLKATVTDCISSYSTTSLISAGAPLPSAVIASLTNMTYCPISGVYIAEAASGVYPYSGTLVVVNNLELPNITYAWSVIPTPSYDLPIELMYLTDNGNGSVTVSSKTNQGNLTANLQMTNACGSETIIYSFLSSSCSAVQSIGALSDTIKSTSDGPDDQTKAVAIFPNPVQSTLNINLPDTFDIRNSLIKVIDLNGKEVKRLETVSYSNSISLKGLPSGLYIIDIYSNKKLVVTRKVVKN